MKFFKRLWSDEIGILGIGNKNPDEVAASNQAASNAAAQAQYNADMAAFEAQKADIFKQASEKAVKDVTDYKNEVLSLDTQLSADLAGFKIGAIPKMFSTDNANVNVRDPLYTGGFVLQGETPVKSLSFMQWLLILGGLYYIFKRRK